MNGRNEIYSAEVAAAGTEIRLNSLPVPGGGVMDLEVSPVADLVVYSGDLNQDGVNELYSASTNASSTQVKLTTTPVLNGDVTSIVGFTSDGSRVLYQGDLNEDGRVELFSANPLVPGSQIRINTNPVSGGDVEQVFLPSDDHRTVVFRGDLSTDEVFEVYGAVPTVSNLQLRLNSPSAVGGEVREVVGVFPDGSQVVYRGDLDQLGRDELYSASTKVVGSQIKLSTPASTGGDVRFGLLSPDASRVVFGADFATPGKIDLYSCASATEGTQIRLTNFPDGSSISEVSITPDSRRVVFRIRTATGDTVWSVPITGSAAPTRLSRERSDYTVEADELIASPDGRRVVFIGNLADEDLTDFFTVALYPPTIRARGPRRIRTSARRVRISGVAAHDLGISRVQFRTIGRRQFRARGTVRWRATVRVTRKRIPVRIQSIGRDGRTSGFARKIVIRR